MVMRFKMMLEGEFPTYEEALRYNMLVRRMDPFHVNPFWPIYVPWYYWKRGSDGELWRETAYLHVRDVFEKEEGEN